jgi:hypothetical protein
LNASAVNMAAPGGGLKCSVALLSVALPKADVTLDPFCRFCNICVLPVLPSAYGRGKRAFRTDFARLSGFSATILLRSIEVSVFSIVSLT